jgi:hypothetical protein
MIRGTRMSTVDAAKEQGGDSEVPPGFGSAVGAREKAAGAARGAP